VVGRGTVVAHWGLDVAFENVDLGMIFLASRAGGRRRLRGLAGAGGGDLAAFVYNYFCS
jgi:hypothetical protein